MQNRQQLETDLAKLPLSETQQRFIVLVAYNETAATFSPTAHNDTASEVEASRRAWDALPEHAQTRLLKHATAAQWSIGSGGFGGRLVPYYGTDALALGLPVRPDAVFERVPSLLSAIYVAHRLQRTPFFLRGPRTVGSLRVGYYGVRLMAAPPADRIAKYRRQAGDLWPGGESFVDGAIDPFPNAQTIASWAVLL